MQDDLQIVVRAQDILKKSDFDANFKKVLELLLAMEKRNIQAIADMKKTHIEIMNQMSSMYNENYKTLRGQVDHLFVKDKIDGIYRNHEEMMKKIESKLMSVKDGKTPAREELLALIKPLIPPPKKGDPGKSENLANIYQDIKELKEDMKRQKGRVFTGGLTGRDLFKDIDISASLDGSTKTFNIQAVWTILSVDLSSFPYGSLRKTTDYTFTPTSITFTDQINAATQLAAGQSCIITAVLA